MDKDTWSRSMVAMLGLDTIGASRMGGFQHADSATPAPARFKRLVLQLKKDDRLPIIRNFRQGGRGEDGTRRAVTSAASGGACASRLAARGDAVPFSGLDGLRRSFTTWLHPNHDERRSVRAPVAERPSRIWSFA